jgi:diadenosine tetraphosphate (Ap4A) HIT family hydrolase
MLKKTLRTTESQEVYENYAKNNKDDGCALCLKASLRDFNYWRIVKNDFPYDKIAEIHDILIPIRHAREGDLNEQELQELMKIKESHVNEAYEYMIEATAKNKSIPNHFHLHLIVAK